MPKFLLQIRPHAEKHKIAEDTVVDFRVIQSLIGIFDRFCVDTTAVFRIVLNFDRQVAANTFDEDDILD